MYIPPATPATQSKARSGAITPGQVADQLSRLELPAPSNLRLNTISTTRNNNTATSQPFSPFSPAPDSALSAESAYSAMTSDTGDISGPEPEAITAARKKVRSESMSAELSDALSKMNLPQPERIFGPNEGESAAARERNMGKQGVSEDDWARVNLADETPEALKEPGKMTHSRNASRA